MPTFSEDVVFRFGVQEEYDRLQTKDDNSFYIITDTKKIYIGETEYTNGSIGSVGGEAYIPKVPYAKDTVPIFNEDGTLKSSNFTLGKSVPSNANFNDTTYDLATEYNPGLMGPTDKIKLNSLNSLNLVNSQCDGIMRKEDKIALDVLSNRFINEDGVNGITQITSGIGLTTEDGESITLSGNIKTKLKDETPSNQQAIISTAANRTYAVGVDSDGYLAVTVPGGGSSEGDGLFSAQDKEKLNKIIGISSNTLFQFCTASEYEQMETKNAIIYFILDDSTLLIKDANDNLLTLGNAGGNNNNLINSMNVINQSSIGTYSNSLTESEMIQNNSGE